MTFLFRSDKALLSLSLAGAGPDRITISAKIEEYAFTMADRRSASDGATPDAVVVFGVSEILEEVVDDTVPLLVRRPRRERDENIDVADLLAAGLVASDTCGSGDEGAGGI